jgi:hypothetical protein
MKMKSKFNTVLILLENHGIMHEHIFDDECEQDQYEFINIIDTDMSLNVEEYTDGFYYTIDDRGMPPLLGQVSLTCFLNVVIHIVEDQIARVNGAR